MFTCLVAGSRSPAAALLLPPGEAGPAASRAPHQEEDQRVSEDRDNFLSPPVVVLSTVNSRVKEGPRGGMGW